MALNTNGLALCLHRYALIFVKWAISLEQTHPADIFTPSTSVMYDPLPATTVLGRRISAGSNG